MQSQTFHPFPRLPKELRDAIWALAIRPEQPSAHFFTVFDSSNDAEWSALSRVSIRHPLQARCGPATPESHATDESQERQFSWSQGNRSAYLIDSGLWTACTESRNAIERRFKVSEWKKTFKNSSTRDIFENPPVAPAVVSFTSESEWQCCSTYPKTDVFFLRLFNPTTIDWKFLWSTVPIFQHEEGFFANHIALDYDPSWFKEGKFLPSEVSWEGPGTIGSAITAAAAARWAEILWFVDARIKRSPKTALSTTEGRHQFYGDGCRFTEVREGDQGWELDNNADVFRFLVELWWKVDDYLRDEEPGDGSPCSDGPVLHYRTPVVGVLAYEEEG